MKPESKSLRGYTLVELLMVAAIVSVMSVIAFANYGENRKNVVLRQAAQQLVLDLRQVQNMAMNVTLIGGGIPSGGFGVHFNASPSSSYILYADTDNNKIYTGISEKFPTSTSPDRALDSGIVISSTGGVTDINFTPPNPTVAITPAAASAIITLRYGVGGPTKNIIVNGITGQITVN